MRTSIPESGLDQELAPCRVSASCRSADARRSTHHFPDDAAGASPTATYQSISRPIPRRSRRLWGFDEPGAAHRAAVGALMGAINSIQTVELTKRYGHHRALASVDLELAAGSVCALLGPNGAGKSTLLGILSTLVRPTAGKVVYAPEAAGVELRAQIGLLAHDSLIYGELTAIENLDFWGKLYNVEDLGDRVAALLDRVGLDAKAQRRPARTYSRGMMQRLALARTLLHDPHVLLLDEPFTGLDKLGTEALSTALADARRDGRLVVVVTHDLDPLDGIADHMVVLRRGKVAFEERRSGSFSAAELKRIYWEHME
jgi:heme exporter protein A